MLTIKIARKTRPVQQPADMTPEEHRQHAAWHLYELVKPVDGLSWWALSDGQRQRFLSLIHLAARASDLTAVRAAHEACASVLATHEDESLRDVPPEVRASYRMKALSLNLTWERVMTTGDSSSDTRILSLVREEDDARLRSRRPS